MQKLRPKINSWIAKLYSITFITFVFMIGFGVKEKDIIRKEVVFMIANVAYIVWFVLDCVRIHNKKYK